MKNIYNMDLKNIKGDNPNNFITMVTNLGQIHPFEQGKNNLDNGKLKRYHDNKKRFMNIFLRYYNSKYDFNKAA